MKRILSLVLSLMLLAGCAPAQPADQSAEIPQPSSVTSTCTSHWAEGLPSSVYTVQLFLSSTYISTFPIFIIGSMAIVIFLRNRIPCPCLP